MDVLNVTDDAISDNRIIKMQHHAYSPYAGTQFKQGEEVRIAIQQQDLLLLPSEAYIQVKYKIATTAADYDTDIWLYNNAVLNLFDDIRYEINGTEIDKCKIPGITTVMKAYPSLNNGYTSAFLNSSTVKEAGFLDYIKKVKGRFSNIVPLSYIFGFAEDFKNVVYNAKHEIIFTVAKSFKNVANLKAAEGIEIESIQLFMPHVEVSDREKIFLLRILDSGKYLTMNYRSWQLSEYPVLPSADRHVWPIKTTSQMEKPRFVIFGLQTARRNIDNKNPVLFDHCDLQNAKLYLNDVAYPYEDFNLYLDANIYSQAYREFQMFRQKYYNQYGAARKGTFIGEDEFINFFLIVFDCSRQLDTIKSGPVDIKITFNASKPIPPNTTAYALIIHDQIVEYSPLTNMIRKIV